METVGVNEPAGHQIPQPFFDFDGQSIRTGTEFAVEERTALAQEFEHFLFITTVEATGRLVGQQEPRLTE